MTASYDVGGNDDNGGVGGNDDDGGVGGNGDGEFNGNGDNDDDSEWPRWLAMQLSSPSSRLVSSCLSALLFFLR